MPRRRARLLGRDVPRREAEVILGQIDSGLASPMTSSAGRLFDAVAALTDVCRHATYDGQPAMLLEQEAACQATREYPFEVDTGNGSIELDTRPIVAAIVRDLKRGLARCQVAGRFHRTIAAAITDVCRILRGATGIDRVCLGGGVFQNDLLASDLVVRLESCDFHVYLPQRVPPGDGGISLGQVLVANARSGE